jgi:hypothetical protein
VTVTLRNGTKEEYNFKNESDRKAYQKKYGALEAPLPPPPPPHLPADGEHNIHAVPAGTVIDHSNVHEVSPKSGVTVAVGTTAYAPVKTGSNVYPVTTVAANPASPGRTIETSPKVATVTTSTGFKPAVAVTPPVGVTVESPVKIAYSPTAPVAVGVTHNAEEEIVLEFKISNTTQRDRLNKMMEEAKAKDIRLEFDEMKFDKDNKLVRIGGLLSKRNSKTEFIISDFDAIVLQVTKQQDGKYQCRVFGITEKEMQ